MNARILDCTLRDGGYINDFAFGEHGIKKIIAQLTNANIDIIECGFLEDGEYDPNCSIYNSVEQIAKFIPSERKNSMYVGMACYGEYDLNQLSIYDGSSIDGIRVTFHYNEIEEAMEYCRLIMQKGYKVFVQPVGTTSYTDEKLLGLIKQVNELRPYAFYLVDTLGLMHQNDIIRFFYLIDHNLNKSINMGFHSHNNLQLSYSNCQALIGIESDRTISLDASVYGMGRGAGNLNTELIANYLNSHSKRKYEIESVLEVVDEFIIPIKRQFDWGYTVPYYLAAINGCHPNYASYLSSKQTLTVKSIAAILHMIEPENRSLFNKSLVEQKYLEFQRREIDDSNVLEFLKSEFESKNIMLLMPGASLNDSQDLVKKIIKDENCVSISISFVPDFMDCDYTFLCNLKRYHTTFNPSKKKVKLIHTSNIDVNEETKYMVNYSSLICDEDIIMDNSSIMMLNLLRKLKVKKIYLAGMDGYSANENNFYHSRLDFNQDVEHLAELNKAMTSKIANFRQCMDLEFVTPSVYNV